MASSIQTVGFIFVKKYASNAEDIAARLHPYYGSLNKKGGFTGRSFSYFIRYENPQGISGTFANAQANSASSKGKQLEALRFSKFGVIDIDCEAMAACADKGAVLDLVSMETDGVLEEMGNDFAYDLLHQYGQRGQVSAIAGNVVTLVTPDDARNFHEGMTIVADDTATGLSPRAGTTTVDAIDEDNGTITLASVAAITGVLTVNDYLFRQGDPGTTMEGLPACTPLVAPVYLSDSFRGIDRGSRPNLLAGSRLVDTSMTPEEMVGRLAIKVANNKRKVTHAHVNPVRFWDVVRRANGKVVYDSAGGNAKYAFETFDIATPAGTVKLVSDPDMQTNLTRLRNPAKEYLKTLGGLPHIVMEDGLRVQRGATSDTVQGRVRGRTNYIQTDTGCFAVGQFAA